MLPAMSRLTPRPRTPLFTPAGAALSATLALVPGCPAPMPVPTIPDSGGVDAPPPMPADAPPPMPADTGVDVPSSPMPDASFDAPPPPPMPPPMPGDAGPDAPVIAPMPPPMPPPMPSPR
jgi:hypothetical protein